MNPALHIVLIVFLVVFQTTVYDLFPVLTHFVDIVIAYVVYVGLFLPFGVSVGLIVVLGVLMDSISGGPFGLYLTVYLWIVLGLKPFVTILNLKNIYTLQMLLCGAVVFENLVLFAGTALLKHEIVISSDALRGMIYQLFWTIFLGPFFIRFFNSVETRLNCQSLPR